MTLGVSGAAPGTWGHQRPSLGRQSACAPQRRVRESILGRRTWIPKQEKRSVPKSLPLTVVITPDS